MVVFVVVVICIGFSFCSDNDDEESIVNFVVDVVIRIK